MKGTLQSLPHSLGYSDNSDKHMVARHEAGHLLMFWLMDRNVISCGAIEGGGVTRQLNDSDESLETPHEHILCALAGMVAEKNDQLLDELRDNVATPERFEHESDSFRVAQAIAHLKGEPTRWLDGYAETLSRLMRRFSRALNETTRLLLEREAIFLDVIHGLFQKWDELYFADRRPKSDLVGRTLGRVFG